MIGFYALAVVLAELLLGMLFIFDVVLILGAVLGKVYIQDEEEEEENENKCDKSEVPSWLTNKRVEIRLDHGADGKQIGQLHLIYDIEDLEEVKEHAEPTPVDI